MSNNIKGKVVVITGASSGLGEAAARHLAEQGAIVALGARRLDRIQNLAEEIKSNGKALAIATDVGQVDQKSIGGCSRKKLRPHRCSYKQCGGHACILT